MTSTQENGGLKGGWKMGETVKTNENTAVD
jgi:hypothetical protein